MNSPFRRLYSPHRSSSGAMTTLPPTLRAKCACATAMAAVFLLMAPMQGPLKAQTVESYFKEGTSFNPSIPTPEQVIGHHVGEWHVTHDRLVQYMEAVAAASDRVTIREIGRTHEGRRQLQLTITSPENHRRLDAIRRNHQALIDPATSAGLNLAGMPVVISMNYSIHGNEPSGSNASMAVVYYMAAAQGPEVDRLLSESVILLDPALNPDGIQRFSTWANMHKSRNMNGDPAHREYNEVWPGGRTNHYWFDMNRDWLPVQQPESRGRIRAFQEFRPNVLTDHHEMGTDATFFFQPGIPSRTNPMTLERNQQLTAAIARYHADRLDAIGSLYYTEESFDDFYYGKGSTYPDIQGAIGILFEQASSRGHVQQSVNGLLDFPFTIRNQVETSLSTWEASVAMREELLEHMRSSIAQQQREASAGPVKGYIVGSAHDPSTTWHFADILDHHMIRYHALAADLTAGGASFKKGSAWVIPADQPQARLIKAMFDRSTTFQDSLFYDVSAWTLPYAMNLPFAELTSRETLQRAAGERVEQASKPAGRVEGGPGSYAWVFEWDDYYAPKALYSLLNKGVVARVASSPFSGVTERGLVRFDYGSIVIPASLQPMSAEALHAALTEAAASSAITVHGLTTGLTPQGVEIGSEKMVPLKKPSIGILAGPGVTSSESGEAWHLLDTRFDIPVSMIEPEQLARADLSRYNVLVFPSGFYGGGDGPLAARVKQWVQNGGTLVLIRGGVQWGQSAGLVSTAALKQERPEGPAVRKAYAGAEQDMGARAMGGSIFFGALDLTHPIAYGYNEPVLPVFRNSTTLLETPKNPYAAPLVYTPSPLAAGYIHPELLARLGGTPSVVVEGEGSGTVVAFMDNPNFRAFWFGTNKMFLNAIFFGHTIDRATKG